MGETRSRLVGREPELRIIRALLQRARAGEGGVVTFSGEPGSGKTRLLEAARSAAVDHVVLRCSGVESEAELPFSGLHELLLPQSAVFAAMPSPQRVALEGALGLGPAEAPRLLNVHAGAVTVLSELARERPVLVLIDDLHWVDSASVEAFAFLARRCEHEPITVIAATRPEAARALGSGEVHEVGRLDAAATRELVTQLLGQAPLDESVAEIVASTGGNPLAVAQAITLLGGRTLTRGSGLDAPLPVGDLLERGFSETLAHLSDEARQALELIAAGLSSDAGLTWQAVRHAGLPDAALQESLDRGVLRLVDGRVEFDHPVLRSLVFRTAPPERWRRCHAVLADLSASATVQAWHRAAATVAPDDAVADALDRAAHDFTQRGGTLAAAQALARAGELTPDPDAGAERLLRAGRAAFYANRTEWGKDLLEAGQARARSQRMRVRSGYELLIHQLLFGAAGAAAAPYLEFGRQALECGDVTLALRCAAMSQNEAAVRGDGAAAQRVAQWLSEAFDARELGPEDAMRWRAQRAENALLHSGRVRAGSEDGLALVAAAEHVTEILRGDELTLHGEGLDFGWLIEPLNELEELELGREMMEAALTASVEEASPHALELALVGAASLHVRVGEWSRARELLIEAERVGEIGGVASTNATAVAMLAYVDGCSSGADVTERLAQARKASLDSDYLIITEYAGAAEGAALLTAGRASEALEVLESVRTWKLAAGQHEPCIASWWPDLIDAAVTAGERDLAVERLEELRAHAEASQRRWALGAVSWFDGVLAPGAASGPHFERAAAQLAAAQAPFEEARARLAYGQRLGAAGRRVEAQAQLRSALDGFGRLGAEPWAARARDALGERGPQRAPRADLDRDALTPQEHRVAELVAVGATNKDAAGELFVSPKTIEAHLSRIYRKLGVSSRSQLAARWSELRDG